MYGSSARTGAAARRERNRAEMRASILQASQQLILEKGVESLTIRGIASALAYSPGAIYEYFESKDAIINELYFEGRGGLGDALDGAIRGLPPETTAIDSLSTVGRVYRDRAFENPEMYLLVFGGTHCPPPDQLLAQFGESLGGFMTVVKVIQQGIEDGEIEDVDPVFAALALWSTVHGYIHLELTRHLDVFDVLAADGHQPTPDDVTEVRDQRYAEAMRMVLRGLATEKGRALLET